MANLRKVEGELEARVLLAKVDASGSSVGAWCRAHGFDGRSLNAWRANLARGLAPSLRRARSRTAEPLRLVELVPSATPSAARYVRVSTIAVELGDDFREETLRRLLECHFMRENARGVCTHGCEGSEPGLCDDLVVSGGPDAPEVGFCSRRTPDGMPSEDGERICVLTCSPAGGAWTEIACGGPGYACLGPVPGEGGICVGAVEEDE